LEGRIKMDAATCIRIIAENGGPGVRLRKG
jgi:hypothetical protein